jgi:phospholipid/cholesterol/gamma-HCH transport system substrate-binding protein
LAPRATIPLAQTAPALDLDTLIGGFRPLFRALQPDQLNELTGELLRVFQGQGGTIASVLAQTSTLTSTLADRGELIGELITNLNTVLQTMAKRSGEFSETLDQLSQLVVGLSDRKTDITNGVTYMNAAADDVAGLLTEARSPLKETVQQTDRATGQVMSDRDYVDELVRTLPDTYQVLARQGLYGDFFNFYMCDAVLKVNGKGGQPVYIKLAGQDTGRCAPK